MKVLVTGSSGLVGRALVGRLHAGGHDVVTLVRDRTPQGGDQAQVRWDPAGGSIDREALDRNAPYDGVVHLAGAPIAGRRWSAAHKREVLDSRVRSTRLLVDSLCTLEPAPGVLVSGSAVGYYGLRGDEELTEVSVSGSGFLAEVCRQWEDAARPAADAGIRTVLLRTGVVLSRDGGALAKQLPLFRLGLGGRTGTGSQYRSWITLADEVGAILHCLGDDGISGPVNATAPRPATDAELASAIGAVLHRPTVLAVPAPAVRLALGRDMAEQLVLGGQRVLPAVLDASGYRFTQPELRAAVSSVFLDG